MKLDSFAEICYKRSDKSFDEVIVGCYINVLHNIIEIVVSPPLTELCADNTQM